MNETMALASAPGRNRWAVFIAIILIILLLLWLLYFLNPATAEGKTVFASSALYNGNFGAGQIVLGHLLADSACQQLADTAGLTGEFKAWISGRVDGYPGAFNHGVVHRFTQASTPYRLVDGTKVADDWADLTDGSLDHAIDQTETGAPVGAELRVWTNTRSNATAWDNSTNCAQGAGPDTPNATATWSCGSPSWSPGDCQFQSGKFGMANATNSSWTGTASSNISCTNSFHLYCVQQ